IISVTLLCVILGGIIGIQFKTVKTQADTSDIERVSEISQKLNNALSENESLKEKIKENEKKVEEYEKYISEENGSVNIVIEENNYLKMRTGMVALEGRGITVTVDDSKKAGQANSGGSTSNFLVHAEDMLTIINELNVGGAEAISINGQRLISTSAIRCAGSVVNVNDVKIAAPFVISAIGDPDILEAALIFPGGVVDSLKIWSIEVTIKKLEKVQVPAYNQSISFKEATVAGQKEE
ncbi:MAG: DUF881 domain-containing protein, partial [Anaerotignaceae bacterium]